MPFAVVRLDLELATAADVPEVGRDRPWGPAAAGDFHHHPRCTPDGAANLRDLLRRKTIGMPGPAPPVTYDVEGRLSVAC
jgi:hypothetical protein